SPAEAHAGGDFSQHCGRGKPRGRPGVVMAGLTTNPGNTAADPSPDGVSLRAQYAAVAQMRWRMLLHSLRTKRGSFEMGARILSQTFFGLIGLAIGVGLGFGAWQITSHTSLSALAALFWPVLIFWQIVP